MISETMSLDITSYHLKQYITSYFFLSVFHKFYLVHFSVLYFNYCFAPFPIFVSSASCRCFFLFQSGLTFCSICSRTLESIERNGNNTGTNWIGSFHATSLFLYLLKILKIFDLSDIFRGYRKDQRHQMGYDNN